MTALTYIAVGLLCVGWLALLIFSLSSKFEKNIQNKQPLSLPSNSRDHNLTKIDIPG